MFSFKGSLFKALDINDAFGSQVKLISYQAMCLTMFMEIVERLKTRGSI